MATPRPPKVVLSERERVGLERLVRAYTTAQQVALRARIVLLAGGGWNNLQIARELGVDDETPGHWRRRWLQFQDGPLEEVSVAKRLADAPKPGAPAKFTPEQVCQIIALACERPADAGWLDHDAVPRSSADIWRARYYAPGAIRMGGDLREVPSPGRGSSPGRVDWPAAADAGRVRAGRAARRAAAHDGTRPDDRAGAQTSRFAGRLAVAVSRGF